MTVAPTRGERNANPGNIDYIKHEPFNGQVGIEIVPPGENYTPRFGRYSSLYYGVRAACEQMLIDCFEHGLTTLDAMISDETFGWAPQSDGNAPDSYRARVCAYMQAGGYAAQGSTELSSSIKNAGFLRAMSGGFFVVENGRYPIGLTPLIHMSAAASALSARGLV